LEVTYDNASEVVLEGYRPLQRGLSSQLPGMS
jgi:hypothetical protein